MSTPSTPLSESDLDYGPTLRGLREGLKVFERYTLVRMLGRGGMGVVWLAHDERLDLHIALKFLPENLTHDEVAIEDLRRETRRCMRLTHTNIVHVYDLLEDKTTAAIAMEHVDGQSLSALRLEKPARVLEAEDLAPLVRQVCDALTYAHESARVVHQDLKPANLMLTSEGILKVMDFGIASSIHDSASRLSQRSASGTGAGTLPYMSPQQLTGSPASISDDVYALGATLYELLTGKPPFYRGSLETQIQSIVPPTMMQRRVELNLEGTGIIPTVWEQVIAACLEKEAEKRPKNTREVWQRLSGAPVVGASVVGASVVGASVVGASVGRSVGNPVNSPASHPPLSRSRKPILITAACVLVIALVLLLAPRQKTAEPKAPPQTEATDTAAAARLAQEKADAEAARLAQEKADAEEKQQQMAAQLERERALKAAEMKKLTAANDPTTAAKETPFVNSLGMKFVPVKITGGPTDGKPVLFSIWDTRVKDYAAYAKAIGITPEPPDFAQTEDHPVVNVSWEDAKAFCSWLTESDHAAGKLPDGWEYRLPSDHEWSCAIGIGGQETASASPKDKGGKAGDYPWGSTSSPPQDFGNYDSSLQVDSFANTSPVGSFPADRNGLYDLSGNAWQWCEDWYDTKKTYRVLRGASWGFYAGTSLRSSFRFSGVPRFRDDYYGFRCVLVAAGG